MYVWPVPAPACQVHINEKDRYYKVPDSPGCGHAPSADPYRAAVALNRPAAQVQYSIVFSTSPCHLQDHPARRSSSAIQPSILQDPAPGYGLSRTSRSNYPDLATVSLPHPVQNVRQRTEAQPKPAAADTSAQKPCLPYSRSNRASSYSARE